MATPNDAVPPKKPGTPAPQGAAPSKPQGAVPPKPGSVPPKPGAVPPKPSATPAKSGPGPVKPGAPGVPPGQVPAGKAPTKPGGKPAPGKRLSAKERGSGRKKLGTVLVDLGFLDDAQLWELLDEAKSTNARVGEAAVNRGLITGEQLMQAMAEQHGLRIVNLQEVKPTAEALAIVPETMSGVYKVLPLSYKDKVLTIAISDPANAGAADDLRNLLGIGEVVVMLAPPVLMTEVLSKCYQGKEESIVDLISEIDANPKLNKKRQAEVSIDLADAMEMAEAAPVRKLINMVFLLAIKDKASDIHFEPFEDEYKMRCKADGVLYEMVPPPRHLANAISTRIKVMSNLDIAERRLPQDGRIELNIGGNPVDMRVSILPTMFGESIVVRVLDRTVVSLDLNKLGMDQETIDEFREMIHKPNGIILVTGPTGSGKTTTLYSALSELNVISDKIITTEDPVEYDIDGIIQVPINHEIGITFASALRSILRQDPDIILVGEIRDLETATIAVQASLTGHTVFNDHPHARHGPGRVPDHGHRGRRAGTTVGSADLRGLPHRVRAERRHAHGTEHAARRGKGPQVLLRQGLRPLQQQRLQGPHGPLRNDRHERRDPRPDLAGRLDRRPAQGMHPQRHAVAARGRAEGPVQGPDQHRRSRARNDPGGCVNRTDRSHTSHRSYFGAN